MFTLDPGINIAPGITVAPPLKNILYGMYKKGFGPIMHALLLHSVDHVNSYGATLNSLNHIIKI